MRTKLLVGLLGLLLSSVAGVVLYLSYQFAGIVATVLYVVLFAVSFMLVPTLIGMLGTAMPGFLQKALGKLNLVLQMFSLGVGIYVQDKYNKWHPQPAEVDGDNVRVWWDGEWREGVQGRDKLSRLGFRPFGLVWAKQPGQCTEMRADPETVGNGNVVDDRGEVEVRHPTDVDSDKWLFDATKFERFVGYTRSDMVTRAEQQKLRKEATRNGIDRFASAIATLIGIAMGGILGLLMTMG